MVLSFSAPSNLIACNICASDISIVAATITAGESGKVVLSAVPDVSVTDNIFRMLLIEWVFLQVVMEQSLVLLVLFPLLVLIWSLSTKLVSC